MAKNTEEIKINNEDIIKAIADPEKFNKEIKNLNEKLIELSYKVDSIDHYQNQLFIGLKNDQETFQNIEKINKSQNIINDSIQQSIREIKHNDMGTKADILILHLHNNDLVEQHRDVDTNINILYQISTGVVDKTTKLKATYFTKLYNQIDERIEEVDQKTENIHNSNLIPTNLDERLMFVESKVANVSNLCRNIWEDHEIYRAKALDAEKENKILNQEISNLSDRIGKLEQTNITVTNHLYTTESNLQFLYDAFTNAQSVLTCSWIQCDASHLFGENGELYVNNTGMFS